jgi:hypothetical protein
MRQPVRAIAATVVMAIVAACQSGGSAGGPTAPRPTVSDTANGFAGFDISIYPGDAAMQAWTHPSSPYYWTGYYLPAPCHRDPSWSGKYRTLQAMGWGVAAIYVGQQDWTQIPSSSTGAAPSRATEQMATCSASLLSADQANAEATDAISRMQADGFPAGSVIFLDVEFVRAVTPALLDYYRAWIAAVVRDGHYRAGVYAAKSNAGALYAAAVDAAHSAGSTEIPTFWITSGTGFTTASPPSAVGLDYAALWQGMYGVAQTWNGVTLTIDVNVATTRSPSLR